MTLTSTSPPIIPALLAHHRPQGSDMLSACKYDSYLPSVLKQSITDGKMQLEAVNDAQKAMVFAVQRKMIDIHVKKALNMPEAPKFYFLVALIYILLIIKRG